MNWAVATTLSQHEAIAERDLARSAITSYTPRFLDHLRRTRVLFPGYLFLRQDDARWERAYRARGITGIIGTICDTVLARWFAPGGLVDVGDLFEPGSQVLLRRLGDIPGMCDGMIGSDRIWVLYQFMGREVRSSFRRADLTLV